METIDKPIYLHLKEYIAVKLLARDASYEAVKRECNLSTLELCNFLATLRRKTGILNTKDSQQAKDYLANYHAASKGPGPSHVQQEVMKRLLGINYEEHTLTAAAYQMGRTEDEVMAILKSGLTMAGIFATTEAEQRVQARIYFANTKTIIGGDDLLTDNHFLALGMYARGETVSGIVDEFTRLKIVGTSHVYVEFLLRQGRDRLGVTARGRGVQRRLVAIALARIARERAEKKENTMDDPMF